MKEQHSEKAGQSFNLQEKKLKAKWEQKHKKKENSLKF